MGFRAEQSSGPAMWRDLPSNGYQHKWAPGDDDGYASSILEMFEAARPAWHRQAACRGKDTDLFYDGAKTAEAKSVCAKCPVKDECRAAGETEGGVWGGATELERRYEAKEYRRGSPLSPRAERCGFCDEKFLSVNPASKYCGAICAGQARRIRDRAYKAAKR